MRRQVSGPEKRLLAAAEGGDAGAQFNLGVLYDSRFDSNERPVEGQRAEAITWLRRAARQGLARAQHRLAELYEDGPEASRNCVKTAFWFQVAMASLSGAYRQAAQSGCERVQARMTPAQVAKVDRAVKAWEPKPESPRIQLGTAARGGSPNSR